MWTTDAFMDEDSTKVVYFSPSFNGISLGLSYAPEDTTNNYGGSADNDGHDKQGEQITVARQLLRRCHGRQLQCANGRLRVPHDRVRHDGHGR